MNVTDDTWHSDGPRIYADDGDQIAEVQDMLCAHDVDAATRAVMMAAAPELYRALLSVEWDTLGRCQSCLVLEENGGHNDGCLVSGALKKARRRSLLEDK